MTLHTDKELFKELIDTTAKNLNLPFLYIEKDYWVTYVLKNLANSQYSDIAIFKGGTSLSKAYRIIDRFSEDIDLAVITNDLSSAIQKCTNTQSKYAPLRNTYLTEISNSPASRFCFNL